MSLEIKSARIEPIRQTYAYIERRFGAKPATRYQEASFDIQGTTNFHYRPLWKPNKTLNDASHTALTMQDWYAFKDPRQFYYATYVQHRARLQDSAEGNYSFFEKRKWVDNFSDEVKAIITQYLLPFRYVEQTANLHMMSGSAYGYGTVITQACVFAAMDHLGMAQYISRIGLLLDGQSGEALQSAKQHWMQDQAWQGIRRLCEESLLEQDWFRLFCLQNLLIDSLMQSLVYGVLDRHLLELGGRDLAILTEFMQDCLTDLRKWSDSVFKVAVAESEHNKVLIESWLKEDLDKVITAFSAWSNAVLGQKAIDTGLELILARCNQAGIQLEPITA